MNICTINLFEHVLIKIYHICVCNVLLNTKHFNMYGTPCPTPCPSLAPPKTNDLNPPLGKEENDLQEKGM